MKKLLLLCLCFPLLASSQQKPCEADTMYRQFDFWLGEWEAFSPNNTKAGDSKITRILDGCVVLEEWTSATITQGLRYAGKSYNTWNKVSKQWQQTWVDNVGGSTEFLSGAWDGVKMVFTTAPFAYAADTMAVRRLSFYPNKNGTVRQHGEISKDNNKTWVTEYDLLYKPKH